MDCKGPDEVRVFFTQIYYDSLKLITDKYQLFDYLLYLADRGQSVLDAITHLKETLDRFLEICPLIVVILPLLPI